MEAEQLTLGLPKKNESCDLDYYVSIKGMHNAEPPQFQEIQRILIDTLLNNFLESPEEYFNFGFNYNDFKSFLLKLVWMRSQRRYFERNLNEKFQYNHYDENQYGGYRQGMEHEDDSRLM